MTVVTGQFIADTKQVFEEGIVLIDKVSKAQASSGSINLSSRDAANTALKNVFEEGSNIFGEAKKMLEAQMQNGLQQTSSIGLGGNHKGLFTPVKDDNKSSSEQSADAAVKSQDNHS